MLAAQTAVDAALHLQKYFSLRYFELIFQVQMVVLKPDFPFQFHNWLGQHLLTRHLTVKRVYVVDQSSHSFFSLKWF